MYRVLWPQTRWQQDEYAPEVMPRRSPHSAFFTPQSMRDIRGFSARTAGRYLRDGRLENCVNEMYLAGRR